MSTWKIIVFWDASAGARRPFIECYHTHSDGSEHKCSINPQTEFCEKRLILGKCPPETEIKYLDCREVMKEMNNVFVR
ncbi:MAG: hypothetical protein COS72_02255 [Candidatus Moranbacteria bacterium CG06_land_8_20_14_3_00_43_56]|nr:MAG: hypothetical protein COS72_02255 [Candidatus Moranbacteria bacterium CG06_land_8_20_14_3_00_43_56]PIV83769.1 MAG: hypothetical protein COW51_02935 [Candidatus Moranbacteria bacterium CG17_big_fil_post_rev_8_21_14_2_50_44_12]PIW92977.1 MAG: hypothetical protein COZ87_03875 [Candidatus Moranbacteria bacterium CG_4_8_14_3_um_filter_43_15]